MSPARRRKRRITSKGPTIRVDDQTARRIFGGNVVHRRERLGLTGTECAARALVTVSALAAIEGGHEEADVLHVARVAGVIGCDTADLMGGLRWVASDEHGHWEID